MNATAISKYPSLSRGERWGLVVLGMVVFGLAGMLYFHPASRTNTAYAETAGSKERTTSGSKSDSEPTGVVVAMLTASVFLVVYGLNGVRMFKFSSPMGEIVAEPVQVNAPADSVGGVSAAAAQTDIRTGRTADIGLHTLDVLLFPLIAPELRPPTLPGPPIPLTPREVKPGQQMSVTPGGLSNVTSVFYFSHDVMLCFAALLLGGSRQLVFHTANMARTHLSRIGFAATPLVKLLEEIMVEFNPSVDAVINEERRSQVAAEVFRLSRTVGLLIEQIGPKAGSGR